MRAPLRICRARGVAVVLALGAAISLTVLTGETGPGSRPTKLPTAREYAASRVAADPLPVPRTATVAAVAPSPESPPVTTTLCHHRAAGDHHNRAAGDHHHTESPATTTTEPPVTTEPPAPPSRR